MGVVINKTKEKGGVKATPKGNAAVTGVFLDYKKDVDRLAEIEGEVNAALAKVEASQKEAADIRKHLSDVVDKVRTADQEGRVVGSQFDYIVSAKPEMRRIVSMADVRKVLGDELFMKCAKVTLSDLDKYAPGEAVAKLTVSERTGARRGKLEIKS